MQKVNEQIYKAVSSKVYELDSMRETGPGKAELASLRRGIGKTIFDSLEAAEVVLKDLPEELIDNPKALNAIFTSLTLFALQQQGNSESVVNKNENTIGTALREYMSYEGLTSDDDRKRIVKRLEMLLKSKTIREISVYLKNDMQLIKGSKHPIYISYPKLAEDLYWFQFPKFRNNVLLNWAKDFYRTKKNDKEEKE